LTHLKDMDSIKGSESLTHWKDMDSIKGSESLTHLEDMDSDPLTGRPLDWQLVLRAAEMDLTNVVSVTA